MSVVARKVLVAVVVLASTVISAPSPTAQPLAPSTGAARQATRDAGVFHAFADEDFKGPDAWFGGVKGECNYVGDTWNDRIRSARTEDRRVKVELWDNADCTGGSIVIDDRGYHAIGAWVSAYRAT
ncbi:hypothetical protein CTZ27_24905 [Streptomyces griseocarneus]|nr:hypothetical protein CTZ27_24905 [Streptomyces griseocarneus]